MWFTSLAGSLFEPPFLPCDGESVNGRHPGKEWSCSLGEGVAGARRVASGFFRFGDCSRGSSSGISVSWAFKRWICFRSSSCFCRSASSLWLDDSMVSEGIGLAFNAFDTRCLRCLCVIYKLHNWKRHILPTDQQEDSPRVRTRTLLSAAAPCSTASSQPQKLLSQIEWGANGVLDTQPIIANTM